MVGHAFQCGFTTPWQVEFSMYGEFKYGILLSFGFDQHTHVTDEVALGTLHLLRNNVHTVRFLVMGLE